jgi:hypothetical protein
VEAVETVETFTLQALLLAGLGSTAMVKPHLEVTLKVVQHL